MRVLIIGCGYVGLRLAGRLSALGHEVVALRREPASVQPEVPGLRFSQADITEPNDLAKLKPDFDTVVNLVSSTKGGVEEYRRVYLEGTRNVLQWLRQSLPSRYLYTSSTSVYGQNDGSWVSEETMVAPESATSRILVEVESELRQAHENQGFPAITLRVAGIYGPGRGHLFKQFLRDEATLRDDGGGFINNVHLEDVAGALVHLIQSGVPGKVYNVVDNEPVSQRKFYQWLSATLDKPMPPSAPADPNRKRGLTNKRVSNARLRATGYVLLYPTFREGYAAEMRSLDIL